MPNDPRSNRLSPDEVEEVLRRSGVSGGRFTGRPTAEEVAVQTGQTADEVLAILTGIRSLGTAIDTPSGDLEDLRLQAQDLEVVEDDPRALGRIANAYAGVDVESGVGRRLPKSTKWVLIVGAVIFFGLILVMVTRNPPALPNP